MPIPPQLVGTVANLGVAFGKARHESKQRQAQFAGAVLLAAEAAIDACAARFPAGSPVWEDVAALLGSPESAIAVIERFAAGQPLGASAEATPFATIFAEQFIAQALNPDGVTLETAAILTSIELLKREIRTSSPPPDPLNAIPWQLRPGAPEFLLSVGLDGSRFLTTVELVGGAEPGGIRLSWSVDDGPEVEPLLMPQVNTKTWKRQAKPADCVWPAGESHVAHLRIRFVTADGEHGYHYHFPVERHEKGHWLLNSHLGSGVRNPEPL